MTGFADEFATAVTMIGQMDRRLAEIIVLSLRVSLSAVALAALIGMPLGAILALTRFPGRQGIAVLFNVLMGLPPVVVGLIVYLMLSRSGPLGVLGLLFSPTAMIIAQVILVTPIIVSLTRETIGPLSQEYGETFASLGTRRHQALGALLWDGRFLLVTALLAGFGRATAEVGAVMIVGGNIDHVTRVMTTAIALESSKGNLALALGLGIILIALSLAINIAVYGVRLYGEAKGAA
ncbi:MAG: ABC transporter permease [Hyphomicrobiales bacterium]|nr:MAG: ABC transporter permease [Hyphomicrobiales bacterium]